MIRAKGRRRTPGTMNGLEQAWAARLKDQQSLGMVEEFWFEPMNLRLAPKCFYKPDFMVITSDGFVEFHECKGFFEHDAQVRIKVAAEKFPQFVFRVITKRKKKDGGGFEVTVIGPKEETNGSSY